MARERPSLSDVFPNERDSSTAASSPSRASIVLPSSNPRLLGSSRLDDAAEELLGLGAMRPPEDLGRRALFHDAPGVEESDPVGGVAGETHLVGGDHHRQALFSQFADEGAAIKLCQLPPMYATGGAGAIAAGERLSDPVFHATVLATVNAAIGAVKAHPRHAARRR